MDLERAALKAHLLEERKVRRLWQGKLTYLCQCELCGRPFPTDLHESLVSRRPTQLNDALQQAILTSPCNLNLLCNRCNVQLAEMVRWRRHLVGRNIMRYGVVMQIAGHCRYDAQPLIDWLNSLPMTSVTEYIELVKDVQRELNAPPNHEIEGAPNRPPRPKEKKARKQKETA